MVEEGSGQALGYHLALRCRQEVSPAFCFLYHGSSDRVKHHSLDPANDSFGSFVTHGQPARLPCYAKLIIRNEKLHLLLSGPDRHFALENLIVRQQDETRTSSGGCDPQQQGVMSKRSRRTEFNDIVNIWHLLGRSGRGTRWWGRGKKANMHGSSRLNRVE